MFLHLSVSHSVHRGGGDKRPLWADIPPEQTPMDRHPLGRHPPRQTPLGRHTPLGSHSPGQKPHPLGRHPLPPETATAADGTHPTGMHSCFCGL